MWTLVRDPTQRRDSAPCDINQSPILEARLKVHITSHIHTRVRKQFRKVGGFPFISRFINHPTRHIQKRHTHMIPPTRLVSGCTTPTAPSTASPGQKRCQPRNGSQKDPIPIFDPICSYECFSKWGEAQIKGCSFWLPPKKSPGVALGRPAQQRRGGAGDVVAGLQRRRLRFVSRTPNRKVGKNPKEKKAGCF